MGAIASGAGGPPQGLGRSGVGGDPGWGDSEKRAREQCNRKRERQYEQRRSCADGYESRIVKYHGDDGSDTKIGDQQAEDSSEDGQYKAFCERLVNEASARCPECETHRRLCAARRTASEQKVGDVRAGDQEYQ